MKIKTNLCICCGLTKIILLGTSFIPKYTLAACIDADVSFQAAAYFSSQSIPTQNNNVRSQTTDDCFNQSAATSNVQVYSGNGNVVQERNRSVIQDTSVNPLQQMGIDTPNIQTHIEHSSAIPLPFNLIAP